MGNRKGEEKHKGSKECFHLSDLFPAEVNEQPKQWDKSVSVSHSGVHIKADLDKSRLQEGHGPVSILINRGLPWAFAGPSLWSMSHEMRTRLQGAGIAQLHSREPEMTRHRWFKFSPRGPSPTHSTTMSLTEGSTEVIPLRKKNLEMFIPARTTHHLKLKPEALSP